MPEEKTQTQPESNTTPKPDILSPSTFQMDLIYAIRRSAKTDCNCEVCQELRKINKILDELKPETTPKTP